MPQGRKFAGAAADYHRGRPDWPDAVVDVAADAIGLSGGDPVVELGAGTGKLTRLLARRFDLLAVEPLAEMRAVLAGHLPGVRVVGGTAEAVPFAGGVARAVFVADAFHWFDGRRALAEAARVLRPGGGIVLLWNLPAGPIEPPPPPEARRLVKDAIATGGEPGGPRVVRGEWREAFAGSPFEQPRHERVRYDAVRDRAGLVAGLLSISSIAGQPAEVREALRDRLVGMLPDRTYREPLYAEVYWARLVATWCDRCGGAQAEGSHEACAAARVLEPPRYCPYCRRRMVVQVLPAGWTATCAEHGYTRSSG